MHALSRDATGRVVATGRLLLGDDGPASIGRMATDPAARGRGHGAAVLAELQRQAAVRGVAEIELHAQVTARGFYERAGYTAVGDGVRGGRDRARHDAPAPGGTRRTR